MLLLITLPSCRGIDHYAITPGSSSRTRSFKSRIVVQWSEDGHDVRILPACAAEGNHRHPPVTAQLDYFATPATAIPISTVGSAASFIGGSVAVPSLDLRSLPTDQMRPRARL